MKLSHKTQNTFKRGAAFALAVAAILVAPASAQAGDQVPFNVTFDTVAESTVNFPIARVEVVGEGVATHLGAMTVETTNQTVNLITGAGTATYYFTAANGNVVVAEFVFTATPTPTGLALNGSWEITGGTGRFAGASGSGTTQGNVDFISATVGLGHVTMDGTISSPGSR